MHPFLMNTLHHKCHFFRVTESIFLHHYSKFYVFITYLENETNPQWNKWLCMSLYGNSYRWLFCLCPSLFWDMPGFGLYAACHSLHSISSQVSLCFLAVQCELEPIRNVSLWFDWCLTVFSFTETENGILESIVCEILIYPFWNGAI